MQFRKLALPFLLTFFLVSCAPPINEIKRSEGWDVVEYSTRCKNGAYTIDKHYYDKNKDDSLDSYTEANNFGNRLIVKRGEKDFEIYEKEFEDIIKEYEGQEKKKK